MKHLTLIAILFLVTGLAACKGDDNSINNNLTNCYGDVDESGRVFNQAEGSSLTATRDGDFTLICGDQFLIDAIIQNSEPEELASFLSRAEVQ